jgi:hypothetical protein
MAVSRGRYTADACALRAGSKLAPADTQQLVQQGGAVLLQGDTILFQHKDTGPPMTADVDKVLAAAQASKTAQTV